MKTTQDSMRQVLSFIVIAAGIKFLLDGVTITVLKYSMDMGHLDPLAYAAILTPVCGAHGVREFVSAKAYKQEVDNPDENK